MIDYYHEDAAAKLNTVPKLHDADSVGTHTHPMIGTETKPMAGAGTEATRRRLGRHTHKSTGGQKIDRHSHQPLPLLPRFTPIHSPSPSPLHTAHIPLTTPPRPCFDRSRASASTCARRWTRSSRWWIGSCACPSACCRRRMSTTGLCPSSTHPRCATLLYHRVLPKQLPPVIHCKTLCHQVINDHSIRRKPMRANLYALPLHV